LSPAVERSSAVRGATVTTTQYKPWDHAIKMDVSIWVLALLMVQCVLMAMILLNSVLTSYLPNGVKAVEHPYV
jgi:type VI protein secretion system component VasF